MAKKKTSDYLTINEAAAVFGVTRATVLRWRKEENLPVTEFHGAGFGKPRLMFSKSVLRAWAEQYGKPIKWAAPLRASKP